MWEARSALRHSLVARPLGLLLGLRFPHLPRRGGKILGMARLLLSQIGDERWIQLERLDERLRIVGWPSSGPIEAFSRIEGVETGGAD